MAIYGLTPSRELKKTVSQGQSTLTCQTACDGDFPILKYEIFLNGKKTGEVPHLPQVLKRKPFSNSFAEQPVISGLFPLIHRETLRNPNPYPEQ